MKKQPVKKPVKPVNAREARRDGSTYTPVRQSPTNPAAEPTVMVSVRLVKSEYDAMETVRERLGYTRSQLLAVALGRYVDNAMKVKK